MSTIRADNISTVAGVSAPMLDAVQGSARAWVNFNGTGTIAIRGSYNVSSITDGGVGIYTLNFTTAMPNTNYAIVATNSSTGSLNANTDNNSQSSYPVSTTQARVLIATANAAAAADSAFVCAMILGAP